LRDDSRDVYALDLTVPTALVFGNEQRGVTDEAAALADHAVTIPMQGMVESLNISVACAVTLYEAMRQRSAAGMYDQPQLDAADMATLRDEWITR
jgi:tRNA (guanosine-2'-O-)-methyltransferase